MPCCILWKITYGITRTGGGLWLAPLSPLPLRKSFGHYSRRSRSAGGREGGKEDGAALPLPLSFSSTCSHFGLRNNNKAEGTNERPVLLLAPLPSRSLFRDRQSRAIQDRISRVDWKLHSRNLGLTIAPCPVGSHKPPFTQRSSPWPRSRSAISLIKCGNVAIFAAFAVDLW